MAAASSPDLVWAVQRHAWKILLFVAACGLAAYSISACLKPLYESAAIVDVDRQAPAAVLGQEVLRPTGTDTDQFLATQVKLLESDSVLRPVAQQYKLQGAWNSSPVRFEGLRITRPPNTYLLQIAFRSADPRLSADVVNAIARSYMEQTYTLRVRSTAALSAFMEKQLEQLKRKMEGSSAALARFERELGIVNPEERSGILSARLLQLNTEYTNAQIDRVRKEGAWQSIRSGALEAAQVSTQGEALKNILERLDEAAQKFAEIKIHYGANHPEFRKAAARVNEVERQLREARENAARRIEVEYDQSVRREAALRAAVVAAKTDFDRLSARAFDYQALKRDAEGDKKLYEDLVRRIREADINAGFESSVIRIADPARPASKPVFPKTGLNVLVAVLFSTLLAMAAAVARERLHETVRDSRHAAAVFHHDVLGALPAPKSWRWRSNPGAFEDSVRSLRHSLLLGSSAAPKSVMITSTVLGEGRTTAAVHLAMAHARRQRKTLLIDADLRRPAVPDMLGFGAAGGLTAALRDGFQWRKELVRLAKVPDLDVLPAGPADLQAADLLGPRLHQILRDAAAAYDLIVIDAPPVLEFPEPLEMALAVDGVVMVAKTGSTTCRDIRSALDTLGRVRAPVLGIILNQG